MSFLEFLEKRGRPFQLILAFALIACVGVLDLLTGYELSFSVFYVMPISLVAWLLGPQLGMIVSLTCALVWLGTDVASGPSYSQPFILVWNTLIRSSLFASITLLLSALRNSMKRERALARTDNLTGAVNWRSFSELAQMEINRLQRFGHTFTLAYMDVDNFKAINDKFGHTKGNQILCNVVSRCRERLRKTDVVARLGGDEFALVLPETNQEFARVAMSKLRCDLLGSLQQGDWPITFSIGVVTCCVAPPSTEELVRMADELMYSVKRSGKNAIEYSTYTG